MNRKLVLSLVLAVSALAAACAPSAPPAAPAAPALNAPADIAALNAAREGFMKGYEAGDAEAIGNLYTKDAISESNNQPSLKGRDAIVASLKGMFEQVTVKTVLTAEDTKTLGNVGVDTGRYAVIVTPKAGATPYTNEGRYMVVYVKDADGQWRVWRDMDNAIGSPRPAPAADAAAGKAK
ncbi:MAG: SgcJ/EcaC family oxidoreductase [Vicinamibacterales bacterium]|nr:SgcJ/EcaC family oxidoreductase [Vicinamibacterales bacterium]